MNDFCRDLSRFGIKSKVPDYCIRIECGCGNKIEIPTTWEINMNGIWQFKCKDCGNIINVPDGCLWETEVK
jgi:hypothetical protein